MRRLSFYLSLFMVGEIDPFLPSILILDPLKTPEHLSGNIGHGNIGQK